MPAYLVGQVTVKEPAAWARYVDGVAESLRPHDAEVLFRGRCAAVLAGTQPHEQVVAIRFADLATLHAWHDGAAYQALVPLRDEAADVVITAYEA